MSALVSVLCGGAGAWAYQQYLVPYLSPQPQAAPPAATSTAANQPAPPPAIDPAKVASSEQVKALSKQVDNLSSRIDKLQERLVSLPSYEPTPDLSDLKTELSELARNHEAYHALPERVNALSERVVAIDKAVTALRSDVMTLGAQAKRTSGPALALLSTTSRSDLGKPADNPLESSGKALAQGVDLFKKGQYAEARDVFGKLEQSNPDDARVWYFAALANGMASGNWRDETERLAIKGVERERAGTPETARIDAAFADLTTATGKGWLASYRKRAAR
jgi:TolA-binding protein